MDLCTMVNFDGCVHNFFMPRHPALDLAGRQFLAVGVGAETGLTSLTLLCR